MIYSNTKDLFKGLLDDFMTDDLVRGSPNYKEYFINLGETRQQWAHCYRENIPIRGNHKPV